MKRDTLTIQKRKDLIAAYDRIRSAGGVNMGYVSRDAVIDLLMQEPAPRFYLSPRAIEHDVIRYIKGKPTTNPERTKDLHEAYCKVMEKNAHQKMFLVWLDVSMQPAKSFYLSRRSIRDIIYGYRK